MNLRSVSDRQHVFGDYLAEQADKAAQFEQTAFEQTAIWQALFDFQRDGC